jgi:hypothetical protein
MVAFCVVAPLGHVGGYQHFGEMYCLHFQSKLKCSKGEEWPKGVKRKMRKRGS